MGALSEELIGRLETKISFVIPGINIPVPESVVVTWAIMALLVLLCIFLVRDLQIEPGRKQICLEVVVGGISSFFEGILGPAGSRYVPYLGTVALYLVFANLSGLVGVTPPTKDLNVTAGLAIMSILLIEYAGIHQKGTKGWLRSFAKPMAVVAPLNILEVFIKPLSLCMRLFGNVLGAFVIMEIIKIIAPALIPIPFSFYFDIFDGLIQVYVFVFLTALFMKEAMED